MMDNIINQLYDSLFAIQNRLENMEKRLERLMENNSPDLFFSISDLESGGMTSKISFIFHKLMDFIPRLNRKLSCLLEEYLKLVDGSSGFFNNMDGIENGFNEIITISDWFCKIKLLAKIEFTKMENRNIFTGAIEKAIDDVINTSNRNNRIYTEFKKMNWKMNMVNF